MYKNRVENDRNYFLKFPLFYFANKEIQQKTEQENSKNIYYFEFSHSGFPGLQDKKSRNFQKKNSANLYPIFIHTLLEL